MADTLGAVQRPVLAALAAAGDGLTVAALAAQMGRDDKSTVRQAVRLLARKGYVRVLRTERRWGPPASVWAASTAGRKAIAAEVTA